MERQSVFVVRTGQEFGEKSVGSRERKGIMVQVGWVGQEQGEYEVVGNLKRSRKVSDVMRGSNKQYSFCFFPRLLVLFLRKSEFCLCHTRIN